MTLPRAQARFLAVDNAVHSALPERATVRARRLDRFRCAVVPGRRQTRRVIHEVDAALLALIEREATGTTDVEVVFDAPTKDWAGRRNAPTIDVYLYDIREDLRRRERGLLNEYDARQRITARHLPPRYFKLSYLVTAWTQRPEDEHRLLSSLLACFLRHEALPDDLLTGPLAELGLRGAGHDRAPAPGGPVLRRRLVGAGRRAQALAGHRGQRADLDRSPLRSRHSCRGAASGLDGGHGRRLAARERQARRPSDRAGARASRRRPHGSDAQEDRMSRPGPDGYLLARLAGRRGDGCARSSTDVASTTRPRTTRFAVCTSTTRPSTGFSVTSNRAGAGCRVARTGRARGRSGRGRRPGQLMSLARDAKLSDLDVRAARHRADARPRQQVRAALRLSQRRRDPATRQHRPGPGAGRRLPDVRGGPAPGLPRPAHSSTTAWCSWTTPSGRSSPGACGCRTGLSPTCWATAPPRRRCDSCSRMSTDIRVRWPTGSPWGCGAGVTLTHVTEHEAGTAAATAVAALSGAGRPRGRRRPVPAGPRPRPRRPRSRCRPRGAVAGRRAGGGTDRGPRGASVEAVHRLSRSAVPVLFIGAATWDPRWSGTAPLTVEAPALGARERARC